MIRHADSCATNSTKFILCNLTWRNRPATRCFPPKHRLNMDRPRLPRDDRWTTYTEPWFLGGDLPNHEVIYKISRSSLIDQVALLGRQEASVPSSGQIPVPLGVSHARQDKSTREPPPSTLRLACYHSQPCRFPGLPFCTSQDTHCAVNLCRFYHMQRILVSNCYYPIRTWHRSRQYS